MTITLSALQKQRYDTAANWTAENPTLLAGEIGVESDTGKIKIGTGSTAWTSLSYSGLIPGSGVYPYSQLLMPSGTAGAPSISFDGDGNTGIYRSGADQVAISTSGTKRIEIQADGDIDIDGGGVFYDATNNRLAIGVTSPSYRLHVAGTINSSDPNLGLRTALTNGLFQAREFGGSSANNTLEFNIRPDSGKSGYLTFTESLVADRWSIGIQNGSNGLRFISGTPTSGTERCRIDGSGRLLVGTSSSPSAGLGQYALAVVQGYAGGATGEGILSIARGKVATSMVNTDTVGQIAFTDNAGNTFAKIVSFVDGTVSSTSDLPGALSFSTTADGASSPTQRLAIYSNGAVELTNGSFNLAASAITSGAGTNAMKYSTATGLVTYDSSSRLIKTDIVDCPYGIDAVKQLKPRKYFRTDDKRDEVGFVADEVAGVMPEFVPFGKKSIITRNEEDTEEIPLGVNYDKLTAVLTKALQEAVAKIEALDARLTAAGM